MMATADDQIEYLPLFVYGTLLERHTRDSVLGPSVLRTERAAARGRWENATDYPAASFRDPVSEISGELVWLIPERLVVSVQRADQYERAPRLYRRVVIHVRTGEKEVRAYAYEWTNLDLHESDGWRDYCCAACRKISIGEYHLECLRAQASHGHLEPTIPVQAHLEGILFAFVAAADQTAEAINLGMDLQLKTPNLRAALEKMPRTSIRGQLFRWHDAAIAADVRDLRVRATRHHYVKSPADQA
jgi:gamma-glutamylcyclotransferase (GGCT)/AIG2-like uncharacterized protein YtfP